MVTTLNPPTPVLASADVAVDLLWRVSGDEGADTASYWQEPSRIALGDSAIYVLDGMAQRIYAVSFTGEWIRTLGGAGGGPGEFVRPYGLAYMDGLLVVGDNGKGSIEVVDPSGGWVASRNVGALGFELMGLPPRGILVNTLGGEEGGWQVYPLPGRSDADPTQVVLPDSGQSQCKQVTSAFDQLLELDCTVPTLCVRDPDGRLRQVIRIDREAEEATPEELATLRAQMRSQVAQVGYSAEAAEQLIESMLSELRIKRSMRGSRFDSERKLYAIWEQVPEDYGGGAATLHLFTDTGIYLAALRFPSPWADVAISDSHVFALAEDSITSLRELRAYKIELPAHVLESFSRPGVEVDR